MNNEVIRNLAYELYKQDWKKQHLTQETVLCTLKKYGNYMNECIEEYIEPDSFEEWVDENGYDGEVAYATFYEFLDNEYLEIEYVIGLLVDKELIELYYLDIRK